MRVLKDFKDLILKRHYVAENWKNRGRRVIGWSCSYTPEELIYAAGALPVMVFGDLEPPKLADAHLPINCCSFIRSGFNAALRGDYNYLDGFVTANSCDNRNKIFDFWRYYAEVPYTHYINTPSKRTKSANDFFYEEILRFKTSLEASLGTSIPEEVLEKTIQLYNKNRLRLREVYELRKQNPPLISGVEAMEIVLSSMLTSKEEHNVLLDQLLTQVSDRPDPPKSGVRILVSGSIMDNTKLIEVVESVGGSVVADDWCIGSRYFWDLTILRKDLLRAISDRYLNKVPSSFMYDEEHSFTHTHRMTTEFNVEAAIIFTIKFCDTHLFDAPQLVEDLQGISLPVLCLEWDHSSSGIAQLKTRIEAFIEMLKGVD